MLMFPSIVVSAEAGYAYGVSLCYDGDAYSVDYVFNIQKNVEILSVSVSDTNCFYDWNYVESEARLYISIASANVIPKRGSIATIVTTNKEKWFPEVVSVIVNGNITENVSAYHATVSMEWMSPGYDTPGQIGGEKCPVCDVVLIEPEVVPPTGPKVKADLDERGLLTVSGGLSDNKVAENLTFVAVYDELAKMLKFINITELDQSDFSIIIDGMGDANYIKILRWEALKIRPVYEAVEVTVKSE